MDFDWIWKAALIVIVGTLILRFAGRKSISQLTVSQTVIMISIGTLMIQPVSEKNIWVTFLIALTLVVVLIILEFLQTKNDRFESFITGKAKLIIDNGVVLEHNLKKLRLTIDQLEVRLRQANVKKISDVKFATIEPSGQLGYVLKDTEQYATKQDIQLLINYLHSRLPGSTTSKPPSILNNPENQNLFTEVKTGGEDQSNHFSLK